MIDKVRIIRHNGVIRLVRLLDKEGCLVDELPCTSVDVHFEPNSLGTVSLELYGTRIEFEDTP